MTLKQAHRPCPICGDREVSVLHRQRFVLPTGCPLPDHYDVVWSPRAGFAYADTPASQDLYDQYYTRQSKYDDRATSTGAGGSPCDVARLHQTAAEIARAIPHRATRIVDVGCAGGGLLAALQELGYSALSGIDPSPACVRQVQAHYGLPAQAGGLFNLPPMAQGAEAILLSHVLEHVVDLRQALQAVTTVLAPGGFVHVEVPDAARYHDFVLSPFQDFNLEHINHFSRTSLENLFRVAGFTLMTTTARTCESAPGCPYPVLSATFRRARAALDALQTDDAFRASMLLYVTRSQEALAPWEQMIAPLTTARTPLVVWGTGQLTLKLLTDTALRDATIVAFVDGNPVNQGRTLAGRPVLAPHELPALAHHGPILVATQLHTAAITRTIREELKLTNPLIALAVWSAQSLCGPSATSDKLLGPP